MADPLSSGPSYKQLKEDFVSNLSGGEPSEISFVTIIAPAAVFVWAVLQSRLGFFKEYTALAFLVDYVLNVAAILLSITLYANTTVYLYGLLLAPAVLLCGLPSDFNAPRKKPAVPPPNAKVRKSSPGASSNKSVNSSDGGNQLSPLSTKPFLTYYRSGMMIITCIAILAVDFRLFPRRFAKVETWGTSLMDVGVGSFVFAAGLVAARPVLKERAAGRTTPLVKRLSASLRHSLPLLALGVVRLLSVKGLDYAEHVSEYGVHWNFFFTLGFLPPFVALFQSALKFVPSYAALAVLLGVLYQVLLESTSLKAFILTAPRTDLFSANREGIFSFLGYLAIFLAGQDTGMYLLPRSLNPNSASKPSAQRKTLIVTMTVWFAVWTALFLLTTHVTYGDGLAVSRRMANLPYVLWTCSFNTSQLLLYCLVETFWFPSFYQATDARTEKEAYETATSRVLRAYNRNGLPLFLLANLMTGLVNMTVPTLSVGPPATVAILVTYSFALTVVAVALDAYEVTIKL